MRLDIPSGILITIENGLGNLSHLINQTAKVRLVDELAAKLKAHGSRKSKTNFATRSNLLN